MDSAHYSKRNNHIEVYLGHIRHPPADATHSPDIPIDARSQSPYTFGI